MPEVQIQHSLTLDIHRINLCIDKVTYVWDQVIVKFTC